MKNPYQDTIAAIATPNGIGAIGVIRLSGPQSIEITNKIFDGKDLQNVASHTLHFGNILVKGEVVDEVLVSVFKAPNSFTKEESIEISCHGSSYIINRVLQILIDHGARTARPGEFTQRAFLNGRFDLAQAEAVADLIEADSKAAHQIAINQMRGGFSKKIVGLRNQLIEFTALLELELDFGEEDVSFANRDQLNALVNDLNGNVTTLLDSFKTGNALKNGVPVAIIGKPNAGKSTLLNALLEDQRAIVSDIAGTTRDSIEEEIFIEGIKFRLIDTAGIRETNDKIERLGVSVALDKMKKAQVILYLFDPINESIATHLEAIEEITKKLDQQKFVLIANKSDLLDTSTMASIQKQFDDEILWISAKEEEGIDALKKHLSGLIVSHNIDSNKIILSNTRHYQALSRSNTALNRVLEGIDQSLTTELLAFELRQAIEILGEITGEVTNNDVLDFVFSKFCIGK